MLCREGMPAELSSSCTAHWRQKTGESRNLHQRAGRQAGRPGAKGLAVFLHDMPTEIKASLPVAGFSKRVIAPQDKAVLQMDSILSLVRGWVPG